MPSVQDPNLGLNYGWDLGESGWKPGMDDNLKKLGAVINAAVLGIVNTPSATAEGTRYIVGSSPTGDFAGKAGNLAVRVGGAWTFYAPAAGWVAWVPSSNTVYRYNGSAWVTPPVQNPAQPFLEVSGPSTWTFNGSIWTKVPMETIATDTESGWDAANNTDYVIPKAGMYLLQGIIRPARSGSNAIPDATAFAAGVGTTLGDADDVAWAVSPDVSNALFTLSVEVTRRFASGDRVFLYARHAAASAVGLSRARLRILRLTD